MPQSDTPFVADFRALLAKHQITHPRFAHGLKPFDASNPQVLYSGPVFGVNEMVAAVEALVEGRWSVAGEYVHRFEREFSRKVGNKHGLMVNSGSSANLVLMAAAKERLGWKDGDEVITSALGFPTTASVIPQNGLTPVWADIELDSLNIDLDAVEQAITPRTRAVFIAPVLGNPPDMDRLTEVCRKHDLTLLLDDCDSLMSTWGGAELPRLAYASTCSLYPTHHLSALGGGMVTSDDERLIEIARSMASWGRDCWCSGAGNLLPKGCCGKRFSNWLDVEPDLIVDHRYTFPRMGWNLLPLDLQGALGLAQLDRLDGIVKARQWHHSIISEWLYRLPGVRGVRVLPKASVSWFGVPIIAETQRLKDALVQHLERNHVQTRGCFAGNLLAHKGFAHLGDYRLYPNANQVLRRVFFIGCAPFYTDAHLAHIEATIRSFVPPVELPAAA